MTDGRTEKSCRDERVRLLKAWDTTATYCIKTGHKGKLPAVLAVNAIAPTHP